MCTFFVVNCNLIGFYPEHCLPGIIFVTFDISVIVP